MSKFKIGQRVILPENKEEGWKEERGEVLEVERNHSGMYIVEVDRPIDRDDDRIREVHESDMREE